MLFILCIFLGFGNTALSGTKESLAELDMLILSKNVLQDEKDKLRKRMIPYIRNIEYTKSIDIDFNLPVLKEGHSETYVSYNPSIVKTNKGFHVICRASNFKLPRYIPVIRGEPRKNKSFFLTYDESFNLIDEQEIVFPSELMKNIRQHDQVTDCRLIDWNGTQWLIGWACMPSSAWLQKLALCKLENSANTGHRMVQSLTIFFGPQANRSEKNWMPIIKNNNLRFIYSYDPFVLLAPNIENGECQTVLSYSPILDFSRFRGSAAPIDFENGYLMMIHEVFHYKKYLHRFVYLNKDFVITKVSLPFTFTHVGVEFCLAMTIDHSGKNLVIPIGIQDEQAKILVVNLEYVKALLHDIPH